SAGSDLVRLGCLLAAASAGTAIARIAHARAAYRRLTLHKTLYLVTRSDPLPQPCTTSDAA
ncbi:hypothetical protein ACWGIU_29180, partial [Streptomyces sp. NPDC054840]